MIERGDLVELSAYGKKLRVLKQYHNRVGMVMSIDVDNSLVIDWFLRSDMGRNYRICDMYFNRRDIKIFSKV